MRRATAATSRICFRARSMTVSTLRSGSGRPRARPPRAGSCRSTRPTSRPPKCAAAGGDLERLKLTDSQIEPVQWADLDGWAADDHAAAFSAFRASCTAIARQRAREDRPMLAALKAACKRAPAGTLPEQRARAFFEDN